jgi:hypothetical protein
MRYIQLEDDGWGCLVCRHDPGDQDHGDMIEFLLPDDSTVLVRVLDLDMIDSSFGCDNCPFLDTECPVLELPDQERRHICSSSIVYEQVGSSMEDL